jgi:hypothetical protein
MEEFQEYHQRGPVPQYTASQKMKVEKQEQNFLMKR